MSEKSVAQKLMLKPGRKILLVNEAENGRALLGEIPPGVVEAQMPGEPVDVVLLFARNRAELETWLEGARSLVKPDGMVWVLYTKGTSKLKADIHRDSINDYARTLGMEGIFIISVNEDWSALRLKLLH